MEHKTFDIKTLKELEDKIKELSLDIPISNNIDVLQKSVLIGDKEIPNPMVIHPMEGCDGTYDGKPDELTLRRYKRFAAGGAGLLWVEATAVAKNGRANPRQLYICRENLDSFKEMYEMMMKEAEEVHGASIKPYTVIQLTHSGRYSRPESKPAPIIAAHNPYLDKNIPEDYPVIIDDELEALEDEYVIAATQAKEIGFDAVDIKSCHRYLISELLSSHTREGKYGGSFENRTRFLLNIIDKIRDRVEALDITLRLNAYDAIPYPYGWGVDKDDFHQPDLSEPKRLIRLLKDRGVNLVNLSCGNPYYNPHVGRPYDKGSYIPPQHPLEGIEKMLKIIRKMQAEVPDVTIVSTGFSWLRDLAPYVAAGGIKEGWFKLAGFGRQAFAYPDFARDIVKLGKMERKKCCITCSKCTEIMRDGGTTGCVPKDVQVYGPIYKMGREGKPSLTGTHISEHV